MSQTHYALETRFGSHDYDTLTQAQRTALINLTAILNNPAKEDFNRSTHLTLDNSTSPPIPAITDTYAYINHSHMRTPGEHAQKNLSDYISATGCNDPVKEDRAEYLFSLKDDSQIRVKFRTHRDSR